MNWWITIFSGELQVILFIFSFIWRYFDVVIKFFFKRTNFLMELMFVVVVWFCRSSSLAFLISAYLINLMHHFLLHWIICFGGYLFVHTPVFFFEKYLNFLCFSICSSFGRQLCQNCGWAGSEPYVRSHITEPPGYFQLCTGIREYEKHFLWKLKSIFASISRNSITTEGIHCTLYI